MTNSQSDNLSFTVGITTCYGDDSMLETVKSIRAQKGIEDFRFIIVADRVPISARIKKEFKKYNVELIENKTEGSQIKKQKQILALTATDIIILTQDDVLYKPGAFSEILRTFRQNPEVTLVSVRNQHLSPLTFFESLLNVGTRIASNITKSWRKSDNYLACVGRCMAFRTKWLKEKIKVPESVATTDAYYYFSNKFAGGKHIYLPNVAVYFRNPQNMMEHLRKSSRFQYSELEMTRYFDKEELEKEYSIPLNVKVIATLKELFRSPVKTTLYFGIRLYTIVKRLRPAKVLNPIWEVDVSTKKI